METKIQKIAELINERDRGWYTLKPEFDRILGSNSASELLNELESELNNFSKGKQPHYCLIFYLALLSIITEKNELQALAKIIGGKNSYRLMKNGLKIFLSAKSSNFKYEGKLLDDRYKNKYAFVDFFSGRVPDYEMELRGYLNIFELIYEENKQSFWELLGSDRQNVIALCLLLNGHLPIKYQELVPFLMSKDELKANGAFFYIMNHFSYLVRKYEYEQTKENGHLLQEEVNKLKEIFAQLPTERRMHFIVNYLFQEQVYPNFFAEELKTLNINKIMKELEKQDLNNLVKLLRIKEFIRILERVEIERVFTKHFLNWIKNDANTYTWNSSKETVKDILALLKDVTKKEMMLDLAAFRSTLFISSFDRQVRYSLYLKDEGKKQVIEEIRRW
ncbi:hypothetical protein AWH48_08485 [Domibacillus aminovorans]|uniref:Uncharacterized protein n=1 Tax=Domibacillus aminovorans TaxID=29332 RepID=A0A177KMG7_9BACI|nr:hypothetical protein [Domibacillus aminovorans]OAH54618.1 hypothetical protein AWH48_08485 [Domibacillus aminovorans]